MGAVLNSANNPTAAITMPRPREAGLTATRTLPTLRVAQVLPFITIFVDVTLAPPPSRLPFFNRPLVEPGRRGEAPGNPQIP